jgi:hypothetical protein
MTFTLPTRYEYLTKTKKTIFLGKNLRTIYLIHLIDHIIKEYDNFEPSIQLYSKVMKQVYGNLYSLYVDYLTESGFIEEVKGYSTVKHQANGYKLTDDLSGVIIYRSYDYILRKKLGKYISSQNPDKKVSPIPREIRKKLINDLQSVTIDFDKSINYLRDCIKNDVIKYVKNLSMINKIRDGDLFYTFDD